MIFHLSGQSGQISLFDTTSKMYGQLYTEALASYLSSGTTALSKCLPVHSKSIRVKFIKKLTEGPPFPRVDSLMGSLRFSQSPYQQCLKWEFVNWRDTEWAKKSDGSLQEEPQGEVIEKSAYFYGLVGLSFKKTLG